MTKKHKLTLTKSQVISVDCFNRPVKKDYNAYKAYSEEEGRESEYHSRFAFTNNSLKHNCNHRSQHKNHVISQENQQKDITTSPIPEYKRKKKNYNSFDVISQENQHKDIITSYIPEYKRKKLIYNSSDIDEIITSFKVHGVVPTQEEIEDKVKNMATESIKNLFYERLSCYLQTVKDNNDNKCADDAPQHKESLFERYARLKRKKKHKVNIVSPIRKNQRNRTIRSRTPLSEVPSLSKINKGSIQCNHSHKKPKYGYARDYFGRIQERDHYIENRSTNSYHDNSSFDREDDNDSIYYGFE